MQTISRVTIIGLGLIGGSLALALKHSGIAKEIVGVDLVPENLKTGLELNAIDWATDDAVKGVQEADLIILATPVGQMSDVAKLIAAHLKEGCIVTDVGSCKSQVVNALESIFGSKKHYIGGHPMAGSEQAGMGAAHRFLFENAVYVLTPTANTNKAALSILENVIDCTGARIIKLTPQQHDLIVAAVSHLPHLIAVNLVNTVGKLAKEEELTLKLAAGGFKDTTRIAMGNAIMWRDICMSNQKMIKSILTSFKEDLTELEQAIETGNTSRLLEFFHTAKDLRSQIPAKSKGLLPSLFELVVNVPDRPGMIAEIAGVLAEKNINIIDIEILRVREAEGGTIRIGFIAEDEVSAALEVLHTHHYVAKRR